MRRHFVILTHLCCLSSVLVSACAPQDPGRTSTAAASGQVLAIGDLTWADIDALNREKTLFLLAVGMLEEHGPHLPIAAVRGENLRTRLRWPGPLQNDPEYVQIVEHVLQPEREFEMTFERWLGERRNR